MATTAKPAKKAAKASGSKHRYVALLRAINVGGHGVVTMAELKRRFEACGATDVSTYIQSGNVIFTGDHHDAKKVETTLEAKLSAETGKPVKLFVLTAEELRDAAEHNPFDPAKHEATERNHLMFLSGTPDAARAKELEKAAAPQYRVHVRKAVCYFGYSKTLEGRRRTVDFEKILGVKGTARTWKVVAKLIELAEAE